MRSNPGGQLAASEILGRDPLVKRVWHVLERQSVILAAERRIGKTCVIQKMLADVPEGTLAVYRDLEQVQNTLEFAELVFHDVEQYLSGIKRTAEKVKLLLAHLEGAEVGSVFKFPKSLAPHWKALLTKTMEDLAAQQERKLVFLWDEVPLMLYKISQNESEIAAMEILDVLRSIRQTHSKIRMVFTGSIGLHNVISSLKTAGYANDPTNDMSLIEVPPLQAADAKELAARLMDGEGLTVLDPDETARAVAESVDRIPYFIHHVVDQMTQHAGPIGVDSVIEIVTSCITDQNDCWHLNYYRERIPIYYDPDEQLIALALLDLFAGINETIPFERCYELLKSRIVIDSAEKVLGVLNHLCRDHYLIMDARGRYGFRFRLIQQFWSISRGLVQ